MTPVGVLAAIVLLPTLFLMVLRVNATLVFLSLCLGNVLTEFVAGDANDFLGLLSSTHATTQIHTTSNVIKLVLLLLPVLLTAVFMIRTVQGSSRLFLNLLPAVGVGLLGSLLVVPLLPAGLAHNIVHSSLWDQLVKAQDLIVGSTALICLFVLWLQRPKTGEGKHGKHKG